MRLIHVGPILALLLAVTAHAATLAGPYHFCYGLDSSADLPAVTDLHLNTVYIQLQMDEVVNLQPVRDLIHQAQERQLKVIVELPTLLSANQRVSPYDQGYCDSAREMISGFVSQLKDEAGVSAWATGSFLERRLSFSDQDFQQYLQRRYQGLDQLAAQWGTSYPTWPMITLQKARELEQEAPYKVGPAAIDVADYEADAYRRVMQIWLEAIRKIDPVRPVFTGAVALYRSVISVPDGYDVICVSMPPDVLESDLEAHNPQGLDMARRGGKFHVLPVFRVPGNADPGYDSGALAMWAKHGALHGAIGFALEDWERASGLYDIERRATDRRRFLINAVRDAASLAYDLTPQATVAVLYSPYASGFDVNRQPVYGYIVDYLVGEPSGMIEALALGTRYGLVDYLSVQDIQDRELDDYGCILVPACLSLPAPQAGQLEEYVNGGGALLADLGLGAYQTKSWTVLPPVLQEACGIVAMGELKERLGDLVAAQGLPALSPWPRSARAGGTFSPRSTATASATERRTYPVSGWSAEALLAGQASALATLTVRFNEDKQPVFAGVVGRQHGGGLALFATHPLWQYWPMTDGLSQVLHGHLMARRAKYQLVQRGLLQGGLYFSGGEQTVGIYNPGQRSELAQLWAYAAGSHAFTDCASNFAAAPAEQGLKPGTGLLVADVPGRQFQELRRTNLVVQPYAEDATVQIREYAPERMVLDIAGAGAIVAPTNKGLELRGGDAVSVRMVLSNGVYPVVPYSRHTVTVRTRNKETRTALTANERGELDLSGVYGGNTLTITPG